MEKSAYSTVPLFVFAAIFIGIGIYSIKKKTPMHFWSMSPVKLEEISDVKSYNKENGLMWIVYGSTYILAAIFAFFGSKIAPIIIVLSCTIGLIVLVFVYQSIYWKYKA
mgnify:CR=1 FL=1|jgi:uncharacterized membrane protein